MKICRGRGLPEQMSRTHELSAVGIEIVVKSVGAGNYAGALQGNIVPVREVESRRNKDV